MTTAPKPEDVVGNWRGFTALAYARWEFKPDGTGIAAMKLPRTNLTAETFSFTKVEGSALKIANRVCGG